MTFGLSMIVRDAAHMLPRILDHASRFHQVVIVDTGSSDGTRELIRKKYPFVQLFEFEWKDNFSDARNFALSKMTTDVWMWLDADDTFTTSTLAKWFKIAKDMVKKGVCVTYLPYHYAVDENDNPLVLQYRERIMRSPSKCEWREPIHEVCVYTGAECPVQTLYDAPVVHKPLKRSEGAYERNWRILHTHRIITNPRTLYYIMREALGRGQVEYAIAIGERLLELNPGGWIQYEALLYMGDAWYRLGSQHNDKSLLTYTIQWYTQAISLQPDRNEARYGLALSYVALENVPKALETAELMKEELPATTASVNPGLYGSYKYALLSKLYGRYLGELYGAITNHVKSISYNVIDAELALENEKRIFAHLNSKDVGVIYADSKYLENALWLKESLLRNEAFRDVVIVDDPRVLLFARKVYFHITDDINTCYMEDPHPHTAKYLISDINQVPVGWVDTYNIPTKPEAADWIVEGVLAPVDAIVALDADDALLKAKASRKERLLITFDKKALSNIALTTRIEDTKPGNQVQMYFNGDNLVAIYGNRENIVELHHIPLNDNTVSAFVQPARGRVKLHTVDWSVNGIPATVSMWDTSEGTVVFYADGLEEWDGTTPYTVGIGASESSLAFLAEALVVKGYQVIVFGPVSNTRIVAGVQYIPKENFPETANWDVFVSSRKLDVLTKRRAKKQILWMHDLMDAYPITDEHIIDTYVPVSEWARGHAIEWGVPEYRINAIPNAINKDTIPDLARVKGRMAWLSSPDRGLDTLFGILAPGTDMWVTYGWYNWRTVFSDNPKMYAKMCLQKHRIRQKGWKLTGRLPLHHFKALLKTVDLWAYPGNFRETFCVSALEAVEAGVYPMVNNCGATVGTIKDAFREDSMLTFMTQVCTTCNDPKVAQKWWKALTNYLAQPLIPSRSTGVREDFTWNKVSEQWINLFKS